MAKRQRADPGIRAAVNKLLVSSTVVPAFKVPHDAWKHVKQGKHDTPDEFVGHEKVWKRIGRRLGFKTERQVKQLPPVIGGRRRYHHRPLTTWELPGRKGSLTLTTDEMEGKAWNRMKSKRHPAMPVIYDVFEVKLSGKKPVWAIHHGTLTSPPDADWYLFLDTFFRWRGMQYGGLKPASPEDMQEFLEYVAALDVKSIYDPSEVRRKGAEQAMPFAKKKKDPIDKARRAVWRDPGLEKKVKWAKSTLRFLKQNKVKHRDLDPSNLGKTTRGKTVITNIAESRSRGGKVGRTGRISGAGAPNKPLPVNTGDPFGPSPVAPLLRTAQACEFLLDPSQPLLESVHIFSGGDRRTFGLIHMCPHKRAAVLESAFKMGFDPETVQKGLAKLEQFAKYHGGKAWDVFTKCSEALGGASAKAKEEDDSLSVASIMSSMSDDEVSNSLSAMLGDDPHVMGAATEAQNTILARVIRRDRSIRCAVFLASNGLPATVVSGRLGTRAIRGMVKLRYLSSKAGGQSSKLYMQVQAVLDRRMHQRSSRA